MREYSPQFVTGFLGRRDSYQVPMALEEAGMLQRFITGVSDVGWRGKLIKKLPSPIDSSLANRHCPGVSERKIKALWSLELMQNLSRLARDKTNRSWAWADRALSRALRDEARESGADLLLYEPYAGDALTATYEHRPWKALFHFHLHPVFERNLIEEDAKAHPPLNGFWLRQDALPRDDCRVVDGWRHADYVLCASSFTRKSLLADGMPVEKCAVIPYGIDISDDRFPGTPPEVFNVLFVGSGLQRKGVHHLIDAWSKARLPQGATLTLVCRFLDPVLESLLVKAPKGVRLLRGVTGRELRHLFERSALFVMPSLIEGFGQVFLEALSFGCPVLGTPNTCLPDLEGGEADGVFLTAAGDIEALKMKLEFLSEVTMGPAAKDLRTRAALLARKYPWSRFRHQLCEVLKDPSLRP